MTIFVPTTKIFHSIHQNPCNRMKSIEITANNNSATTTTMEGIVTIVPEKTFIDSTGTETLIKNQNKQENGNNQNDKGHQSKLGDASDNQGKNILAESLVETTILITNVIWCNFPLLPNVQVIPLRLYIQETLKRSRTSLSTLQTALLYLLRIKPKIGSIYLNLSSTSNSNLNSSSNSNSNPNIINIDSATCGRRMFLASLIVASKYLQDNNYSNSAWSKISGLSLKEINSIERRFLQLIVYNLYVSEEVFNNWTNLLNSHIKTILDNNDSPNDNNNNNNNNNKGNSDNNSNIDNKSNYSNDSNVNINNNNNNFSNNNIDNNSSNRGNQTVDNHKRNFFMINSSTTTISSKECEVKG